MSTSAMSSSPLAKFLLVLFGLFIVTVFLIKAPLTSSVARTQERVFENAIPENAPIRIKIKKEKEKSFKDLKDESWVREFELEVTNTSEKPIYFLFLDLITDVRVDGYRLVFSLVYGRAELGDIISKAQPDDVPIRPGETYVFKIHPGQVPAWEQSVREKSHPDASRLTPKIETVSFGDGTGYFGNEPYPAADKRQSVLRNQDQAPKTFPYRFLIPEGYVGWIRIDFDVAGAPEIPIEDGFYVFKVPESGRLQTSSSDLVESTRNQFSYYSAATRYRIRLGGPLEGRLVQEQFSGPGSGHLPPVPNHYRYIFIGPREAFENYRATDLNGRPTEADGYPKVGAQTWLTQDDLKKMNAIRP